MARLGPFYTAIEPEFEFDIRRFHTRGGTGYGEDMSRIGSLGSRNFSAALQRYLG